MLPDPRRLRIGSASGGWRILAAILLFCLISAGQPAVFAKNAQTTASSAGPFDSASFVSELGRLKSELDIAGKSTAAIQSFRDSLPAAWTVKSGEQEYSVPSAPITSRLDHAVREPAVREQELNQARDFLDALAAETASASSVQPASTASARVSLDQILARREFASHIQQSWWDRFVQRIDELIFAALVRLLSRIGGQRSVGDVLLWIGISLAAILIAYWIFQRWFRKARLQEMALESAGVPARSWQQWIFASRAAAAQGDYRMAIHCAYWASIARLEELGALPADRAKTPREYLRTLTNANLLVSETHATRYQALSKLTSRLEKVWYGYHIATENDFRDSMTQLEALGCHLP